MSYLVPIAISEQLDIVRLLASTCTRYNTSCKRLAHYFIQVLVLDATLVRSI